MRIHKWVLIAVLVLSATGGAYCAAGFAARQETPSKGPVVHMTVSAEARHGSELPPVSREDVIVSEGRDHDSVVSWVPAQGAQAGLELLVLVDEGSSMDLGGQLNDIRAFIQKQPATTLIGVGYMRFGMVETVQDFTPDHAAAAKAVRVPMGVGGASPYFSLQDLTKHWPTNDHNPRHEILLISSGVDTDYPGGPQDPYVDEAIRALQRVGVVVYSIYQPGVGHIGHSFWRINWGQNYLSQVSEETGGESYYIGLAPAISFAPYLDELDRQLQHQYLLTFVPKPEKKAGMQNVHVGTELSNVDLVGADRIFVPGSSD